ncbi:acyltransferase family protein [Streptomyces verrucosisporus]|uniref:acyltransferase family protein n=1 Tax=Streptomyces verrucosisporus TaxID=1695161 RepID=UPI0019D04144|nr:acyltransferase family protein [Streptomyces verrucosisporus]MBN3930631.1 acyltransferase family protein [Streptomyces verrucosisporus]
MFQVGHERSPLPPARPDVAVPSAPSAPEISRPGPGGGAGGAKQRDAFFDNAKFLAIALVVVGHAWRPVIDDSRAVLAAYNFVYAFHMPAFIIVSGYFSRSFDMRPSRVRRLVTGVLVPYLIFETAYSLFRKAADSPEHPISLLDPWYLTWFLIALFVWRLTTPVWKALRRPLPVALGIALLASVSPDIGNDLDLQRVLQLLPFFVLGLCLRPEHFERVRRRGVRLLSVPVAAAALVFAYWSGPRMNFEWFYHNSSGQELGVPWWIGIAMNLAMFACSLVLAVCFFAWVPRRHMWFTALGAGTLYAYLLHGFLVQASRIFGWYDEFPWITTPAGIVALTIGAAALAALLCGSPVRRTFRFAMEPRMDWIFRRDAAETARRRSAVPDGSADPANPSGTAVPSGTAGTSGSR